MEYKRFGNTVVVRMDKGEEIVEQVKQVALKENIKLAQVSRLATSGLSKWPGVVYGGVP